MKKISFFQRPIANVEPVASVCVIDVYNLLKSDKFRKATEALRSLPKEDKQSFKAQNFDFVTFSGEFTRRNSNRLTTHSNLMVIDFDHLNDLNGVKELLFKDPLIKTVLLFVSPSGDGLKWIIPCDIENISHKEYYKAVSNYLLETYELYADASGSDVTRSCYLPYDPEVYINPNLLDNSGTKLKNSFNPSDWLNMKQEPTEQELFMDNLNNPLSKKNYDGIDTPFYVESLIIDIEACKIDVTSKYDDWRNIAFALSDEFGESGRIFFHRLSRFYPGYNPNDCNRQYDACLRSSQSGITIGTLIHLLKTKIKQNTIIFNLENQTQMTTKKLQAKLSLPTSIYEMLPPFLKEITDLTTISTEKDVFLLGALSTISGAMPNVEGFYDKKKLHPNLFLFVTAPAGAGKGNLNFCKKLVYPIHLEKRNLHSFPGNNSEAEFISRREHTSRLIFRSRRRDRNSNTYSQQINSNLQMLFIPANSSSSGAFQLLHENDGVGIIFETEADTLSNAFKSEHGDYSDGLRKAFAHEPISFFRRADNENVDISYPRLSCVLSGTPKQIQRLIKDGEDGLMSRFLFYYLNSDKNWKDVFAEDDVDFEKVFEAFGQEYLKFYHKLQKSKPIRFKFTESQKIKFHDYFSNESLKFIFDNGEDSIGIIRRVGVNLFRIAMILTLLRQIGRENIPEILECETVDFDIAMEIMKTLKVNSEMVYRSLSKETFQSRLKGIGHKFYNALQTEFTKDDYVKTAESIGMKERTAEGYITRFVQWKYIERLQIGKYKKADLVL